MQPRPNPSRRRNRPLLAGSAFFGVCLLASASLVTLGCGSGSEVEPVRGAQQPIAGGQLDKQHSNVFLLASHFRDNGAERGGLCTSTLIAPNLLLTARHCVSPNTGEEHVLCGDAALGTPYPPAAFAATNDPQPTENSPLFHAAEVRVPDSGSDTCGYDVALVILAQNVPPELTKPAVPRIDREVQPGELYTAVGYGENDVGLPIATRLERTGLSVACEPGSCGEGVESTEFLGETGICSGDSGGPALDADGKVVGVVSRGGEGCDTPVYSTVTAWYDLVIDTAKEAATLGGYEPPFWVTGSSDAPEIGGTGGAGGADSGDHAEPATCNTTSDCDDGLVCQPAGAVSLCVAPSGTGDDKGGCNLAHRESPALEALLVACFAAVSLRRARRRTANS